MVAKTIFIEKLASILVTKRITRTGEQVAHLLNKHKHLTNRGKQYVGGRGAYKVIDAVYYRLKNVAGDAPGTPAHNVSEAFTNSKGGKAYWGKPMRK